MKIIHFSQYYTPESTAGAFGAADNTRNWVKMGADVTVFTAYPNHPGGRIHEGYTPKLISTESIDGVKVVRSKLIVKESKSYINKLINTLSFFSFGIINFIFNNRKIGKGFDVVTAADGPIFATLLGSFYASLHKIPFVFEVRDLTWLQLIALGKSEKAMSVRVMKKIELHLARKAKRISSITNGFKKVLVSEGVDERKIYVITNGVDTDGLTRREYKDAGEQFVMGYYGVLGLTQNITETFPYADEIRKHVENFKYLVIGEGAHKEKIRKAIEQRKGDSRYGADSSDSIVLMDGMQPEVLESYYDKTSVGVATLEKSNKFSFTIPSKVFQIMARGVAVFFIGPDGEAAQLIRDNNAGLALTGTRAEDLRMLDDFFSQDDWYEKLRVMGDNGYKAIKSYYSRSMLAQKYYKILQSIKR